MACGVEAELGRHQGGDAGRPVDPGVALAARQAEHLGGRLGPVDHLLAQPLHLNTGALRLGDLVGGARLREGGGPLRRRLPCGRGWTWLGGCVGRGRLVSLCGLVLGRLGPARRIGARVPLGIRLGRIEGAVRLGRKPARADRLHHRDVAHTAPARVFPQRYAHARGTSKIALKSLS